MPQLLNGKFNQIGARRLSVMHFLIGLIVLIVATPFLVEVPNGELLESILLTLVLLLAVAAVGGQHRSLLTGIVLVTPALITKWVDHFRPGTFPSGLTLVPSMVFASFVVGHLLVFILRAPWVNAEVLCAAVSTFLMMGVLWSFAYILVAQLVPGSFVFTVAAEANRSMGSFEALYFSFGTLTAYYGDIIPVSRAARTLAMVEATVGLFFVAVLIARMVALYSSQPPQEVTRANQRTGD